MANQKTTELRRLLSNEAAAGDLIPIVDVSELTIAPTGETKAITAQDFAGWMLSSGILDLQTPYQSGQTSNGLYFSSATTPNGDKNLYCYTPFPALGTNFSIFVRGFVPSTRPVDPSSIHRVLFGAGTSYDSVGETADSAYIAVVNDDLVGYVSDGTSTSQAVVTNFFINNKDRVFGACLTKNSSGDVKLIVNGEYIASSSGGPTTINSSHIVMGNGQATETNLECTIYEAQVFNAALTATGSAQLFFGGSNYSHPNLIASYTPENLFAGPTQWLDSKGNRHLLLPTEGARATNPTKKFILNFYTTGSCYLGNGEKRDVLPEKYFLTSCVVESSLKPLISIGSSASMSPVSASGTGSWWDNRVPFTSASYGVNPLGLLALGAGHLDRSLYVAYSGSLTEAPCTFSFEGYIRV
jgi:hypothetical protein